MNIVNGEQGFTIIELMIVIAIIGVLSSIAIPAYYDYITRTQVTESLGMANAMKGGILDTYIDSGICPDNSVSDAFGMAKANEITGRYVASVTASGVAPNCHIEILFKSNDIADALKNKKVEYNLTINDGSYIWNCYSNDIDKKFLPQGCR